MASVIAASVGSILVSGLIAANRSSDLRIEQTLSTQLLASQLALLDDELTDQTPISGTVTEPLDAFTWTLEWTDTPLPPVVTATLTMRHEDHDAHVVTYRRLAQP